MRCHCEHPPKITSPNKKQKAVWRKTAPIFPSIVYKCLYTFKGGHAREICMGFLFHERLC
ncbi:hypothetical protein LEMLEM_LOCUS1976 [Lemmus lemmus]